MDTITGSFKANPKEIFQGHKNRCDLNENSDDDLSLDDSYDSARYIPAIDSLNEILLSESSDNDSIKRKHSEKIKELSQSPQSSTKSVHFANGMVQVCEIASPRNQKLIAPRLSSRMEEKMLKNMKEDLVFSSKLAASTIMNDKIKKVQKNNILSPPRPPVRGNQKKDRRPPNAHRNHDEAIAAPLDSPNLSKNTRGLKVRIPQEYESCDNKQFSPSSSRLCECCKLVSPSSRTSPTRENYEVKTSVKHASPTVTKPFRLLTEERAELRKLSNLENVDEPHQYQFKALPMPNFAYLHSKFNISREKVFTITESFDFELDKRFNGRSKPNLSQDDTNVGRYRFKASRVNDFTFRPLGSSHDVHLNTPVPAHLILDGKLASRVKLTSTRGQSNLLDDNDVIDFIRNVHMSHMLQEQSKQIQSTAMPPLIRRQIMATKSPPKPTIREKKSSSSLEARRQPESSPINRTYMSPTKENPSFSESPRSFTAKKMPDFSKPFIPKKMDHRVSNSTISRSPSPTPSSLARSKASRLSSPSSTKASPDKSLVGSPGFKAKKMPDFSKPFVPKKMATPITHRSPSPTASRSNISRLSSPSSSKGSPSFSESPRSFKAKKMPDFSKPFIPKKMNNRVSTSIRSPSLTPPRPKTSTLSSRSPSLTPSRSTTPSLFSTSSNDGTLDNALTKSPGFKAMKMPDFSKPSIPKKLVHHILTDPVSNSDAENDEIKDDTESDENIKSLPDTTTEPLIKVMERLNKTIDRLNEMESERMTIPNEDPNRLEHAEKYTFDDITNSSTNKYTKQQFRAYKGNFGDDFSSEFTNLFRGGISRGPTQPDFVVTKKQVVLPKDTSLPNMLRQGRDTELRNEKDSSIKDDYIHSIHNRSSPSVEEKVNQTSLKKTELYDYDDTKRRLPVLHTTYSTKSRREISILDRFMYCCAGNNEFIKSPRTEEWNVHQDQEDEVSM